jgi:hypothetical protein
MMCHRVRIISVLLRRSVSESFFDDGQVWNWTASGFIQKRAVRPDFNLGTVAAAAEERVLVIGRFCVRFVVALPGIDGGGVVLLCGG